MSRLVDIDDERFWDILFDEACVEGKQANRIMNGLEKIVSYDVEKVVTELEELDRKTFRISPSVAINIVRKGGVE